MDTDYTSGGQPESGGELSSSGSSDRGGGQKVWKVVTFAVVVALAGTLAAHSLLTPASCGGCGGGGRWMNTGGAYCPEQVGVKTAAFTGAKACCPEAETSFASTDCPLAKQGGTACPNSPGAPKHACCPGARHRWGKK